ncbi:MAG: hypothetical protein M3478_06410 [Planctomycetota bacterium]|nr:hypothetical protein [Planctomycetota bacterium]
MWGNRLGWGISLVIAVAVVGSLTYYARAASVVSNPTPFAADAADNVVAISVPAQTVLGTAPKTCDAAQAYSEAIALYRKEPSLYDDVASGVSRASDASKLPAIQRLIEAKDCGQMTLFAAEPHRVVRYGEVPEIEALRTIGRATVRVGLVQQQAGRNADAIQCYLAAFGLGSKLYDERLTYRELLVANELMGEGGVAFSRLAFNTGDTARSESAQKFEAARRSTYTAHVLPVAQRLISIDARVVSEHAGDVFHLANHADDRMWRVEAILALGRMRFFVGEGRRLGDQRGATKQLKQLVNDKDPVIRAAAKAALDLTREQMRTLG